MKSLKIIVCSVLILLGYKNYANIFSDTSAVRPIVAGYHVGYVQLLFSTDGNQTQWINESDFFGMGFPIGITFNTPGKWKFDLEVVPFLNRHLGTGKSYQNHLLFHPGVLRSLGHHWTFGARLAFELGNDQFGVTPLLNKSFAVNTNSSFFIELVAPMRWGPSKVSSFQQLGGLHLGFAF